MNAFLGSIFRHALTAAGGVLVSKGITDQETVNAAAGSLTEIAVGAVTFGLGLAFSFVEKLRKK